MKLLQSIVQRIGATETLTPARRSGRGSTHTWERWYYRSHLVFYAILTLITLVLLLTGTQSWTVRGIGVVLALALGMWHWSTLLRHPHWAQDRPLPVLMFFAVAIPLYVGLVWIDPSYQFLTFFFYWYNFALWPIRWSLPGAAALTIMQIWLNGSLNVLWPPGPAVIGGFAITLTVSGVMAAYIGSIIKQSYERQRLIEELETTRKELANEERRAGMLEERGRLAREIHDTLAQGFISIVTHLEAAEENLPPGTKPVERHLDRAKRAARENLVEARRLVAALRPEILESSSLSEALERVSTRWSEETGVPAILTTTGDYEQLPQELQVTLLRVAQEALSNIRKHADPSRATLTLSYLEDLVVLDIQDDGKGFASNTTANDSEGGFGLQAMRERVESLGGQLLIESAPGEGTTLVVQLPLAVQTEKIQNPERT
ncbi:MAG: sensor histidine kinase [Rubrobacteraceae bacterium]